MKFIRKISVRINQKYFIFGLLYIITTCLIASLFLLHSRENNNFTLLRTVIIFFASTLLAKYFVYMVLSPWHDVQTALRVQRYKNNQKYNPRVSVIIPAWNEEVGLLTTISSLLKSAYTNMELVIVNDGSTDSSHTITTKFIKEYRKNHHINNEINLVYRYQKNGGKGKALNEAIRLSSGDIIISIDADCAVKKETIGNFVKCFIDPTIMAAVGNVQIANTDRIVGVVQYLEFLFSFYFKKADSIMNTIYIIGGAAGAFRREVFEKLGTYNTKNITEDIELSVRIQNAGMRIVYAADAIVTTEGASDIRGLMKQRLRWKRGRFETFQTHKHLFFSLRKHHNKILTFLILPFAIFGEMQLSFEIVFLAFLYIYSIFTTDFSSFLSGIIVVSSMFIIQAVFDDRRYKYKKYYLLAPIGWLLFYISTYVETYALLQSIWIILRKKELQWQKWQRTGIGNA